MARHAFGFSAILSLLLPFSGTVTVQAAQRLIPPQNDTAGPTDDAPAPPTATDAQRARAVRRLLPKAGTDPDRATQRLLPRAEFQPPVAGVVHLNGLLCRKRQERGHDEIFLLTAGRRTPARSEFRLDDEGSERSVHNQDLFQQTLVPGGQSAAIIEVWESDGGGKHDDLIGSVRVTLFNIDGQIRAAWQPGEFARVLPPTSPATERFELSGNGARYEIELSALAARPEPPKPEPAKPAARRVVETVVVPAPPPPGPSVRVVIPRRRPPFRPRRWYPPRRRGGVYIRW
jgi:hypothetical protein